MRPSDIKKVKKTILGSRYDLSLAFVTPAAMRRAMKYKSRRKVGIPTKASGKNKVSNVLAFPLSKTSGEILICKSAAKPYSIPYLFIHACLHLKGLTHGATMKTIERRNLKRFGFNRHE